MRSATRTVAVTHGRVTPDAPPDVQDIENQKCCGMLLRRERRRTMPQRFFQTSMEMGSLTFIAQAKYKTKRSGKVRLLSHDL